MVNVTDLVGLPFKSGGRDVAEGLDCWGLAIEVFRRYGIELPDFTVDTFAFRAIDTLTGEAAISRRWEEVCRPVDEDVPLTVLMYAHPQIITHAGVLLGQGRVIHTMEGTNVVVSKVGALRNRIAGYYRLCSQS